MASGPLDAIRDQTIAAVIGAMEDVGILVYDPKNIAYRTCAGTWDALVLRAHIDRRLGRG